MSVQMQARSSSNGLLYTWVAGAIDFAAAGYSGPGTALDVAVSMRPPVAGSGSGLSVSGSPVTGDIVKWNGSAAVWGNAAAYDITGFAATVATVEVGSTVTNPAFTASHNRTPTSLLLTNNKTAESKNVVGTPTSFSSSAGSQVLNTVGGVWTFTLTGSDGSNSDVASVSIVARQRNFAGKVAIGNTSLPTLATAAAATYNAFGSSGTFSFTVTDNGTNSIQFMRRTSYGAPASVKDNATGFAMSYSLVATASYTNASGFAESFNLYKLDSVIGTVSTPATVTVNIT